MKESMLIILLIILRCAEHKSRFEKAMESIDPLFQSFFPKEIGTDYFSLTKYINPHTLSQSGEIVTIYLTFQSQSFEAFVNDIEIKSKANYYYLDTCNIIPYIFQKSTIFSSEYGQEWLYDEWVNKINKCVPLSLPIPNFIGAGPDKYKRKNGLPDDFIIHVLDAKPGMHFPEKYYADELTMPDPWKRGYSNGVAISEKRKELIFFLVIW